MKSGEIIQPKEKSAYIVEYIAGFYVGEKMPKSKEWKLCPTPKKALKFMSKEEALSFIKERPLWLQANLKVVQI